MNDLVLLRFIFIPLGTIFALGALIRLIKDWNWFSIARRRFFMGAIGMVANSVVATIYNTVTGAPVNPFIIGSVVFVSYLIFAIWRGETREERAAGPEYTGYSAILRRRN